MAAQIVTNGSHTGISFAYDDANDGAIDATVSLSGFSTSDLSEGTNLYYTDARADARIAALADYTRPLQMLGSLHQELYMKIRKL